MVNISKHFIAASLTATMAFNSLSLAQTADAPENTPEAKLSIPQEFYDRAEQEWDYLDPEEREAFKSAPGYPELLEQRAYERFYYSNEQILERLDAVTDRRSYFKFLSDLKQSPDYVSFGDNAENGSLEYYLEETGVSPYLAIPYLIRSDMQYLTLENLEALENSGADLAVFDKALQIRTNGEMHLHELVDRKIADVLDTPYIKYDRAIQTQGYDGNIPNVLLRDLKDNIAIRTKLKHVIDPNSPPFSLDEIKARDISYHIEIPPEISISNLAKIASDPSFKSPLFERVRTSGTVEFNIYKSMTKDYKGFNLEAKIDYEDGSLELPHQNKDLTLIVTEANKNIHADTTHRFAEALAQRLSPDHEGDSDVLFVGDSSFEETNDLVLLTNIGANNLILSKSYAPDANSVYSNREFTVKTVTDWVLNYNFHENNNTLQFVAAGNDFRHLYSNASGKTEILDSYKFASINATAEGHSNNSVIVGAAHVIDNVKYMSTYSSMGADFLMETPDFYGTKIKGTSFSTPTAAAYYHQVAESFGDVLTHDEIMFAALYSTDTDVYNVNLADIENEKIALPEGVNVKNAIEIMQKNNEKTLNSDAIDDFRLTVFRTNDAGIPFHERAGAGFLNVETWVENLKHMKTMKAYMEHEAEELKFKTQLNEPLELDPDISEDFNYVYVIKAPTDMTLDKQTLFTDQRGLNSIRMTSPSGMQVDFVGTATGYMSTRAFSGEDIKAGDVIIIESTEQLGELAEFSLRGYEDGNMMQAFRDHKLSSGALEANQVYEGDKLSQDPEAALKGLNIREIQSNLSDEMNQDIRKPIPLVGPQPFS